MIKVNLLRNNSTTNSKTASTEVNYDTAFNTKIDGGGGSGGIIGKLLIIFGGVAGFMMYESYNIGELQNQLTQATAANTALTQELTEKKPMVARARDLQKQIQDLETRIKAVKGLSKVRLREIRAIDFLQNIIPEKVWFTQLDFDGDIVKIDGGTSSDDDLNRFLGELESRSMFTNVILLRAVEQKTKEGTLKIFNLTSTVTGVD